ncbi:MAG: 7-cyano-7-deazaguanine synthase [Gemmatimonadetes bacterium]|nr:7-cyano-7-deazaguanine synthase [Gemmatimonadota bacterium]
MDSPVQAVVLVSGGLDSCVAAAEAALAFGDCSALGFLHVRYGQRTAGRELAAFEEIGDHFGVSRRLVADAGHLAAVGSSSLTAPGSPADDRKKEPVPSTYVPFRNANLLAIAVAWAEASGARSVYLGAHERDCPYPDCRAVFFEAFARAVETGTRPDTAISIETPLLSLDKPGIVRRGLELAAPLHLTWSCYVGSEIPCGKCRSCELRQRGFREAGVEDPLLAAEVR